MSNRYTDVDTSSKSLPPAYGYLSTELKPLHIACEPLLKLIPNLERYVKIAKQYCPKQCPIGTTITHDEIAAIYLYTMEMNDQSFYRYLNRTLRSEDRAQLIPYFGYLKLLDTALNKLPSVKQTLWRGVANDVSQSYKKGKEIIWWSVNSCSSDLAMIKKFIGDHNSTLFSIDCKNGKLVSCYSAFPIENEIILMPGTCLQVESDALHHQGGLCVVHLKETGEDNNNHTSSPIVDWNKNRKTPKESSPITQNHDKTSVANRPIQVVNVTDFDMGDDDNIGFTFPTNKMLPDICRFPGMTISQNSGITSYGDDVGGNTFPFFDHNPHGMMLNGLRFSGNNVGGSVSNSSIRDWTNSDGTTGTTRMTTFPNGYHYSSHYSSHDKKRF
ncbi:unnamed protein product [Didymodactylos carnosus]|uniref:NAD(P)(+)--arginine ADP-ribosyltransferase n=1 Tax=Didymodactylos carnosus TaxID=1234261 RepID=A0A815XHI4_9BILA|nr:unnamed protein product [Didymodactylos carnosus]CAF1557639.1 unnamed protein product [Didymodactylos carnosus]CAF3848400.1 unnamed protein product [Didymodactylos carnosus]CAF4418924.1 unnamed protein product [Didymodactylos carnosus]